MNNVTANSQVGKSLDAPSQHGDVLLKKFQVDHINQLAAQEAEFRTSGSRC
uniref:TIDP9202 n=1 Tax=Arundo donax TaxID=35708 RepID=A0A0A9G610_ARUDO